ncbi:MAG: dihydroorotate dehydrogenase electron transfer subunit [Deltaproteobacteria bacterium]|nr:dihydroorotate dehydrogenase electron transfer subunit [Deltaproteobacteria bacterium]
MFSAGLDIPEMKEMLQKKVEILHHVQVGPGYFRMGLAFPELARIARPGQFVMVKLPDRSIPLLRRPFSVHNRLVEKGEVCGFELLYKVVGQGTQAMSGMIAGDVLDVLGPLGKGFSYPEGISDAFLVGGGIGVAPLYYLALDLVERRNVRPTVFVGGCSSADVLCREEFEQAGAKVCITTEDCSLGEEGMITSLVQKAVENDGKPDIIYACGPQAMLRSLSDIAGAHDVQCQVSMETVMACGFGVCLGCVVEKAGGGEDYLHACTDGPVFDSRTIVLD